MGKKIKKIEKSFQRIKWFFCWFGFQVNSIEFSRIQCQWMSWLIHHWFIIDLSLTIVSYGNRPQKFDYKLQLVRVEGQVTPSSGVFVKRPFNFTAQVTRRFGYTNSLFLSFFLSFFHLFIIYLSFIHLVLKFHFSFIHLWFGLIFSSWIVFFFPVDFLKIYSVFFLFEFVQFHLIIWGGREGGGGENFIFSCYAVFRLR